MTENRKYGDEDLGYKFPAESLSPLQAKEYLEANINDCIYMQMPDKRKIALHKKLEEGRLELEVN